jgi:hypothetical protein
VERQSRRGHTKTAEDLTRPHEWTLADLFTLGQIVETSLKSVQQLARDLPKADEPIRGVEKSLKKSKNSYNRTLMCSGSEEG